MTRYDDDIDWLMDQAEVPAELMLYLDEYEFKERVAIKFANSGNLEESRREAAEEALIKFHEG
jgi:hypothetical protein